jgi:hypothetical protein
MARPKKVVEPKVLDESATIRNHRKIQLGDRIHCCGDSFILSNPKMGNRCAVCNKRYFPGDEFP